MSYTELVAQVEEIAAKSRKANDFDTRVHDALVLTSEIEAIAAAILNAVTDDQAREAAMVAEMEERYDAQFDAISANWGHD